MALGSRSLFVGTLIHSKSLDELEYLEDTAVFVDEHGVIVAIQPKYSLATAEEIEAVFQKQGWSREDVAIKTAKAGEFFFPGFIGESIFVFLNDQQVSSYLNRHPYSCLTIRQCWNFWQDNSSRLAQYLYVSHGKQSLGSKQSQNRLHQSHPANFIPRDHHRCLLRYDFGSIHQSPS